MSGTIWQSDAVGADGDTVKLGRGGARSRTTNERAGKQWFLTPFLFQVLIFHYFLMAKNIAQSKEDLMGDCPNKWKLDVNDRYQKAVGVVTSLSTAALTFPIFFLKDIVDLKGARSIADSLSLWVYLGWIFLAISVLSGIVYYFCSAKWVKLAWNQKTDVFGIEVSEPAVEHMLDFSYFFMMIGFVGGVFCILKFVVNFSGNG